MKIPGGACPPCDRRIGGGDVVGYRYRIQTQSRQLLGVCAELTYYVHGGVGTRPPSLERQMEGRTVGETFSTSLAPQADFCDLGWRRLLTLPRTRFPDRIRRYLAPGVRVEVKTRGGLLRAIWIVRANESEVTLDFDPPGRTLRFDISIVSIRRATAAEKRCGYPTCRPAMHVKPFARSSTEHASST